MRQAFDQQIQPLGRSYGNRARQYEVGQKQQFERQAYSSGNELAISQSRGMWGDDAAFGGLAKSRFDATDLYADTYGMPDEWRISEKVRIKESMASSAIDDWIANDPQSFISRNGEPSDLGGVSRFSAHGNSSAARGLRNNNPETLRPVIKIHGKDRQAAMGVLPNSKRLNMGFARWVRTLLLITRNTV